VPGIGLQIAPENRVNQLAPTLIRLLEMRSWWYYYLQANESKAPTFANAGQISCRREASWPTIKRRIIASIHLMIIIGIKDFWLER